MNEPPTSHAVRESLRSIASRALPATDNDMQELQARLCDEVGELRDAGWPIERVVAHVKALADDVSIPSDPAPRAARRDEMVDQMIAWCIDHYYRPASPA